MNDEEAAKLLSSLQGQVIHWIRRIRYMFRGDVTSDAGPIEIGFADDSIVLLDAGPDGEALSVKAAGWIDHFAEPLSIENRQFVEQSGKWTAFDVSVEEPYSRFIGERIVQVILVRALENKIKGVALATPRSTIRVEIEADELSVDIA
jgi:hypothetical protein